MITCIAVDDEPLALDILKGMIAKVPFLNLVGLCKSGMEALQILNDQKIDLIFLDIQMPDLSGIQLLKSLKNPPIIIFTTAYNHYAVESYSLDAIDYLLKPFAYDRFLKAVNKAQEYQQYNVKASSNSLSQSDHIYVRADYKIIKINFADILFIEGLKDYIKIFEGGKPILTILSLKYMEEKLPFDRFIRVHRSFIVSLKKINSIQKNRIYIGEHEVPVGDLYRETFFSSIKDNYAD